LDTTQLGAVLLYLPIFLFSVIVHECSHGLVALWCGDPTAKYAGRLTLNPIPHIDLYGSILLPGILMLSGSRFLIGWAKPVPVDPRNFRHKYDSILVALAGIVSNILLGFVFAVAFVISLRVPPPAAEPMRVIAQQGLILNCLLAIFNLLPIPPLDGHWVALRLLPPNLARAYAHIGFFGIIVIFLLLMIPAVNQALVQQPTLFLATALLHLAGLPFGAAL
jgi:Zn-dependent protease